MDLAQKQLTRVLNKAAKGDATAAEELLPLLYDELRKLAAARMAKLPPGQTLQATALVHEAYLRVGKNQNASWEGRAHFFFSASRAMRDILVEDARRKASQKHGGGSKRVALEVSGFAIEPPSSDVLAVNEAVKALEKEDPENARLVMLRYFGGMTTEETAAVLGVSVSTIERKWRFIRVWLHRELSGSDPSGSASDE